MFNFFRNKKEKSVGGTMPQPVPQKASEKITVNGNVLIRSLKIAISALGKDIVEYKWTSQQSCNCGVVVQALLGTTKEATIKLFDEARFDIENLIKAKCDSSGEIIENGSHRTWREVAQQHCSVTGQPLHRVFELLCEAGLKMQDIVHLEYLNNKAILEVAKIDTKEKEYYTKKENLIKYLRAWVGILEGKKENTTLSVKGKIEYELIKAVNSENFELAAKLRDELAVMQ